MNRAAGGACIPRATYRLQLNKDFNFRAASALVPYLADLGVSHVYCSPYLRARAGSMHGYDIVDHNAFNPEIGTRADFDAFAAALREHGMGQIADIVPNHMGVLGGDNAWWLDVLENGPASRYADYFDIDWQPASPELAYRILLPVLGEHYGVALERGEIALSFDARAGAFNIDYFDHRFPVDPREYPAILERVADETLLGSLPHDAIAELGSLALLFHNLPRRDQRRVAGSRRGEIAALKQRLAGLAAAQPLLIAAIARATDLFNGKAGGNFDAMHQLLESQVYRLAYWRVAADEINYRRFFDVNHLAALRMEVPEVFEATHRFIFDLIGRGQVDGLRIDHPDGLRDPAAYFKALQSRYAQLPGTGALPPAVGALPPAVGALPPAEGGVARPLYVVIEKIVASFEPVPITWAVHGTTGYRYANFLNGLFVDGAAQARITRVYHAFAGKVPDFPEVAYRSRRLVLRDLLASELTVLANQLVRIARADRRTRDYTLNILRQALAEVIACFPVYRTYVAESVTEVDRRYIDWAVAGARKRSRAADATVFNFVRAMLLCEMPAGAAPELVQAIRDFAAKFQQVSSPVMAKGVEDTSFYIYNRLASLNDVGGDPEMFGVTVRSFHGANADRARDWPHAMLASSTHDNKRSEDVRARIDVLSEMPGLWRLHLQRWSRTNRSKKRMLDGEPAPSRNDEYLIYQTLLGSLPVGPLDDAALGRYRERIEQYMIKAIREAKAETSWINPRQEYEDATVEFVRALLAGGQRNLFLEKLRAVLAPLARLGLCNSLSMVLIKLTSPGVPDIYQGNETWDFSLVDPDNRRPVDYAGRRAALAGLQQLAGLPASELAARLRAMADDAQGGAAKLYLTWRVLGLRRVHEPLFTQGSYLPLNVQGERGEHVVAYARQHAGKSVVVLAGRLFGTLTANGTQAACGAQAWGDTLVLLPFLAAGAILHHGLTGQTLRVLDGGIRLAEACADFPAAILIYDEG